MKRLLILAVALLFGGDCANRTTQPGNTNGLTQSTPSLPTPTAVASPIEGSKESEMKKDVPVGFQNFDFKNATYSTSLSKRSIELRDGKREFFKDKELGNAWFNFEGVGFIDITGDGNKEAVVQVVSVICGGSCDGGSHLFYFYSIERGKLKLLSRIETGSIAYTCGLKSFSLSKGTLVLEAFRKCSFNGLSLKSAYDADSEGGKFFAKEFTRFTFRFARGKPVLMKRELLPNSDSDVKNYPVKISITDD